MRDITNYFLEPAVGAEPSRLKRDRDRHHGEAGVENEHAPGLGTLTNKETPLSLMGMTRTRYSSSPRRILAASRCVLKELVFTLAWVRPSMLKAECRLDLMDLNEPCLNACFWKPKAKGDRKSLNSWNWKIQSPSSTRPCMRIVF